MSELEQFIEQYGDYRLRFSHYYKYEFFYKETIEGVGTISVSAGGDSDDIYRTEFHPVMDVRSLQDIADIFWRVTDEYGEVLSTGRE